MKPKSVVVIGAGIGGITATIHLARAGLHVSVLEKNERPGGTSVHEQLDLQPVDPTYRLVFDNSSQLALTSDMPSMRKQLEAIQSESFQGFLRYLREGERHYRLVLNNLVNCDFRKTSDIFNFNTLALLFRLKPLISHYRNMSAYFDEPRLKSAFTFQDIYMGLSPFEAPATYSMMPYTELAYGVWYPKGGMYRVVESLMELALQAGVEFVFNSPVERIDTNATHVHGIRLADGSHLNADVVLTNADLPYVFQRLLPQDGVAEALTRKRYSCSVISFLWGIDKMYPGLGPHMLFLADDYRENFECINRDLSLPANPSLYMHAPARLDPAMALRGQDTLIAIVPVGHLSENGGQEWNELRDEARGHVFRRLRTHGIDDIEAHIEFEQAYTPVSWAKRYNLVKGSTHGLSHTLVQMACFRPSNRNPRFGNLYFVGASTHPGTGIPTAMVSGRLVAKRIMDELGN